MNSNFLKKLNKNQLTAVTHDRGPLLIVAGAGTGKTTVITKRFAYLILEQDIPSDSILAITFTDKAAGEMEERIDTYLPLGKTADLWINTFHGLCDRILKINALDIGLTPNFKLLSGSEQWLFLKQRLFDFNLNYYRPLGNPTSLLYELIKHLSRLKDENITPENYLKYAKKVASDKKIPDDEKNRIFELAQFYKDYQKAMGKEGFLDFGDLIFYCLKLFNKRPSILKKYQEQFEYILVDEFQDTNLSQYELIKLLATPKNNLTVCGDDNQAIYKFRGASVSNILNFKKDFPDCKQIVLKNNYRSLQPILDLSYESIQFNNPDTLEYKYGIDKKLTAKRGTGPKVVHTNYNTVEQEAVGIINQIIDEKNNSGKNWSDFAILLRANSDADKFITLLSEKKIPYDFLASRGLFRQKEIAYIISYLKFLSDITDNLNLFRILNLPNLKINPEILNRLNEAASRTNNTLYSTIKNVAQYDFVTGKSKAALEKVSLLIKSHLNLSKTELPSTICLAFLKEFGLLNYIQKEKSISKADSHKMIENISSFFKILGEFEDKNPHGTVLEFVSELDTMIEAGEDPAPANIDEGPDSIKLLTIHSAKGLEFPHVFLPHLVQGKFPVRNRRDLIAIPDPLIKEVLPEGNAHIGEERRLFYVALTRAKDKLFLTSAEDYGGARKRKYSVFLQEVLKSSYLMTNSPKDNKSNIKSVNMPQHETSKIKYKLPTYFSYSQLHNFKTCPRKYKFSSIMRIPGKGSHVFSYGTSIHNTLYYFLQRIVKDQPTLFGADIKVPSKDELMSIFEECWISDYYFSKDHERKRQEQAKKSLLKFYKKEADTFSNVFLLEKSFKLKLEDSNFTGRIDRIDRLSKDEVEIIDYKTGKVPRNPKEIDKNDQLTMYALAAKENLNLNPTKLTLYYFDEGVKFSTTRTDRDLINFSNETTDTVSKMKSSNFDPTPGFHCSFCDYSRICDASTT